MNKLSAGIIYNGIEGLDILYRENDKITYHLIEVTEKFDPDLSRYDVLIAPNGTDHVALFRIREKIQTFLDHGKILLCFDGWFTDWVPGNRWLMDNSKKTIDVRYKTKNDPFGITRLVDIADLNFTHGISGWWSCGYIEPSKDAIVILEDTWQRPLLVVDQKTTPGTMILSASGPLADFSYATTDDDAAYSAMTNLYHGIIDFISQQKNRLKHV